jgi:predicted PurR-regulated permease PerM
LAAVLLVGAVVVGAVAGLGVRIAEQLPEFRDDYRSFATDVEDGFGIELPDLPGGDSAASSGSRPSGGDDSSGDPNSAAAEVVGLGAEILLGFFLTLALAFLFLQDGRGMWAWALDKVGNRADEIDRSGRAAWSTLGSYVRGLTVVAAFDAAGIGLGLLVLGVPMVATLVALQFVASYVPTIGAFTAGGLAVFIAYVDGDVSVAVMTLVLVVVVQQIGNSVIEPWIMGRSMPLHPAMVLIVVTLGAVVWGIAGALLFVPMAAGLSAVGHIWWQERRLEG